MKKILFIIILIFPLLVLAHQPKLASEDDVNQIENPEISQAYYGDLNGFPEYYVVESEDPFLLYVNLLVPDIEGIEKNVSAMVFRKEEGYLSQVATLNGEDFEWRSYYENFARDNYFKGPEEEKEVLAGAYLIEVSSSDNEGKYVLSIGKSEKFSLKDFLETLVILPKVKSQVFDKSFLTSYFNYVGLILSSLLLGLILLFFILKFLYRKTWKKLKEKILKK